MENIFFFKNGESVPAKIEKMFGTHGPYTIEGKRLDKLLKAQMVVNSSTSTITENGISKESSKTGSILGRAVAGAIIAGDTGAVIGGLSGKKETLLTTVSSESLNVDLTVELLFDDNSSLYAQLKTMDAFYWLLGFANQNSFDDDEIEQQRLMAINAKYEKQLLSAYMQAKSKIGVNKQFATKSERQEHNRKIHNCMFEIISSLPNKAKTQSYNEFVSEYGAKFSFDGSVDNNFNKKEEEKTSKEIESNYNEESKLSDFLGFVFFLIILFAVFYVIRSN